ncbi:MAG: hypothetical protein RLZ83_1246 [Pseudomonadota bacterium]|jgi:hypothetical protein
MKGNRSDRIDASGVSLERRAVLAGLPATALMAWTGAVMAASAAETVADATTWLRRGGVVLLMRHALAPGTFDPPEFRLGDCSTQRNLSAEGREQSRAIGRWFESRGLRPAAVRSSPWCRCVDTATLAFGGVQVEPALGSPRGGTPEENRLALDGLRQRIAQMPPEPGRFEVWVTHMFLISDLLGTGTSSGEGWVVRAEAGALKPLASWPG